MESSSCQRMWLLGLMVLIVQFQISLCSGCLEQERIALLQIKASMTEYSAPPYATFPESWDLGSRGCCGWRGVECNLTTGKVIKLVLSSASYRWPLNSSLFLPFEDLTHLDLSYNAIDSWVPDQGLGRLRALDKLEVLKLGMNNLNNSILPALGLLSTLKALSLERNRFAVSFDVRELSSMSSLEELDLSNNDIIDIKGLESLSKLAHLSLSGNRLNESRTILQSLGALRSLKTLDVAENHFQGFTFRNGSSVYSTLLELDLSGNDLEGMIPSWLGNFTSLRFLDLSYNQFVGNLALSPVPELSALECLIISDNNLEIPVSLSSFSNHSKLKVLVTDNNLLLNDKAEFHLSRVIPKFQLQVLCFSNCWSNNLITSLPNFFHYQSDLRIVDISQINLAVPFPTWLLENNTLLERCKMRNNSLTASFLLPSHHIFPRTTVIDISDNSLTGQILEHVGQIFPGLIVLDMSGNLFGGHVPTSIEKLKYMEMLDLSNNSLSGEIPSIHCPSLEFLRLSHNNLSGQLSPSLYNLTHLEYLYLDDNQFTGEIPDIVPAFSLVDLDLSNNHFSGKLPRWIGNMSGLSSLAMASNNLEGSIPVEFCNIGFEFEFLDLSDNNLSGSIPSCFSPPRIMHVHLNRNKLSGTLTHTFHSSYLLVTLDLLDNNLTGRIPIWISSLSVLLLKSNNFEGEIPLQLCDLEWLSLLDLSLNNLSGQLPLCLGNMTFRTSVLKSYVSNPGMSAQINGTFIYDQYPKRLRTIGDSNVYGSVGYLSTPANQQVEFSTKFGSYSYKGGVLDLMSGIDLSCNHFTGEIPAGIGKLSNIHALNLSHNHLTGPIPTTFSKSTAIESLDLSYNNLNGRIPPQLVELVSLGTFSVAHNNLSGPLPDRKAQFATFDERSYEGNPLLCGPPLRDSCSTRAPTEPSNPQAPGKGVKHDMVEFYASCAASYVTVLLTIGAVLLINCRWRKLWFYSIEVWMTSSYYFVLDTFDRLINR